MVSHHTAKFGAHRYCDSGRGWRARFDIPSLKSAITVYIYMAWHTLSHKLLGYRHNNFPVCSMKDFQSWSHMSTTTTDGNFIKTFKQGWQLQSVLHYTQTQLPICLEKTVMFHKIMSNSFKIMDAKFFFENS